MTSIGIAGSAVSLGMLMAILITVLWCVGYWIEDDREKPCLGKYKTWIDDRNPLYRNGCFRKCSGEKSRHLLFAGPKWLFLCEIQSIFLIAGAWILGIYSAVKKTEDLVWEVFLCWNIVSLMITVLVREHYRSILKKELRHSEKKAKGWYPLSHNMTDITLAETIFQRIERKHLEKALLSAGYERWNSQYRTKNNLQIYMKPEKVVWEVFLIFHSQKLNFNILKMLDRALEEFLSERFGNGDTLRRICVIAFICIDGQEIERALIDRKVVQEKRRYGLPVFYSGLNEELYIPKQKCKAGRRQYQKMYRKLEEILKNAGNGSGDSDLTH